MTIPLSTASADSISSPVSGSVMRTTVEMTRESVVVSSLYILAVSSETTPLFTASSSEISSPVPGTSTMNEEIRVVVVPLCTTLALIALPSDLVMTCKVISEPFCARALAPMNITYPSLMASLKLTLLPLLSVYSPVVLSITPERIASRMFRLPSPVFSLTMMSVGRSFPSFSAESSSVGVTSS